MMQVCTSPQDKRDSWDAKFDDNEAYVSSLIECQIKLLLREAHLYVSKELGESITNLVNITVIGQRKVQAKTHIAVGKLSLAPVSSYVSLGEEDSNNALNLGDMCVVRGKELRAHVLPHTKVANAKDPNVQDFFRAVLVRARNEQPRHREYGVPCIRLHRARAGLAQRRLPHPNHEQHEAAEAWRRLVLLSQERDQCP